MNAREVAGMPVNTPRVVSNELPRVVIVIGPLLSGVYEYHTESLTDDRWVGSLGSPVAFWLVPVTSPVAPLRTWGLATSSLVGRANAHCSWTDPSAAGTPLTAK